MKRFVYWSWYFNCFVLGIEANDEAEAYRKLRATDPTITSWLSGNLMEVGGSEFDKWVSAGMDPVTGRYTDPVKISYETDPSPVTRSPCV